MGNIIVFLSEQFWLQIFVLAFSKAFSSRLIGLNLVQHFLSKSLHAMRWRWCRGIYRRYDDSWWLLITTCVEGSAYEGEEKEHLSPLGLSEGQWAFHVSIRHHFLRRPFLQTDEIFKKQMSVLNEALDFVKTRYEGMEEQFSNNRVIVRPLSWLVCIGPFQPPNKGGLPLLRSRKSLLHFQFFLSKRLKS